MTEDGSPATVEFRFTGTVLREADGSLSLTFD